MRYCYYKDDGMEWGIYDAYEKWASKHGFKLSKYKFPKSNKKYKIIAEGEHGGIFDDYLYGIEDENKDKFIVSERLIKISNKDENKNFLLDFGV